MRTLKNIAVAAVFLLVCSLQAGAQKGNIGFIYPAGAQRGTSVEVVFGGQGIMKATGVMISGEGVSVQLLPQPAAAKKGKRKKKKDIGEEDNLQLADQVRAVFTISEDAPIGMRDVRLILPGGVTNRLYFEIGQLPDVVENGKAAVSASSATLPVTFNGQIMRSDVDRFRFTARKGQNLVLQVKARVMVPYIADAVPGWFQPVIRLYDPQGREVACNDDYTFHVDPVLFYNVPESGEYDVEINDALYRGREDFVYRIDVGELPFITSISPIGGYAGRKTKVTLHGYNLRGNRLTLKPSKPGRIAVSAVGRGGIVSNSVWFQADDFNEGEVFENRFEYPLQTFRYEFSVAETGLYHFSVLARRLGAPTDARLTIYDQNDRVIKDESDTEDGEDYMATHFADPEVTVKLKRGTYRVRVVEEQAGYGEAYSFRLSMGRAQPDFSLSIEPSIVNVPAGGTGVFNVLLVRRQKFKGDVEVGIQGLPDGYMVNGGNFAKGKKTLVSVTAPADAKPCVLNPVVTGRAENDDGEIVRRAVPVESMMQAFYYTHLMPMEEFRMEVVPEQLLKVSVVSVDGNVIKVHLDRRPGFNSPVTVMLKSSVSQVKAEAVVVPEGECDAVLEVYRKLPKDPKKAAKVKRTTVSMYVYGVVKGSSKKIKGKGRNSYSASVTACAPVFEMEI